MAIPRVFLSSTCYDLSEVRDSLHSFIESIGFEPCLSDRGDVFYHPDLHTHDSCINEVKNCQVFILIIGGRFGGTYIADPKKSVVNAEFTAAKELNIPVFAFIKREVLEDHRVYQKNSDNAVVDQISFPSIEKQDFSKSIFGFIDEVRLAKVNNGFFGFENSRDIEGILRKQWAGMFYEFLRTRQQKSENEIQSDMLTQLTNTSSKLEAIVKKIYRQVDDSNAEKVIGDIETTYQASNFFSLLKKRFRFDYFSHKSTEGISNIPLCDFWYEWLEKIGDFDVKFTENEIGGKIVVIVYLKTRLSITVSANFTLPDNIPNDEKTYFDYVNYDIQKCFIAFKSMTSEQRKKLIEQCAAPF